MTENERPRQYSKTQIENRARDLLAGWLFEHGLVEELTEITSKQDETIAGLVEVLEQVQTALADWRDGKEINLEEFKYTVVDPALEPYQLEDGNG